MQRALPSLLPSSRFSAAMKSLSSPRFVSASNNAKNECPFQVLGLSPDASTAALRLRYLQLAKQLHPDAGSSEGGSRARDFIEVRRAYEKAMQIKKQMRCLDSLNEGHVVYSSPPQGHSSHAQEAIKRREWKKQQKDSATFWANQHSQRQRTVEGGQAAAYQKEMFALFQSRVAAEEINTETHKPGNQQQKEAATQWEGAARDNAAAAAAEAWKEHEKEMRDFGLSTESSSCMGEGFYKRRARDVSKSSGWISREDNTSQKRRKRWSRAAVAAAGFVVGAAVTATVYNGGINKA